MQIRKFRSLDDSVSCSSSSLYLQNGSPIQTRAGLAFKDEIVSIWPMNREQQAFVELLVKFEAIRFGDFILKSGRRSPYFIDAGRMRTGLAIRGMGRAFADTLQNKSIPCDLIFGPAYKGIPLAVSTCIALAENGLDRPFCFDRKEVKDHGEGGLFVGTPPESGMNVVIVDDVITSGISIRQAIQQLKQSADINISGVIVAVDRKERGSGGRNTLDELCNELKVPVFPIVSILEIVEHLHGKIIDDTVYVDDGARRAIESYLAAHGA